MHVASTHSRQWQCDTVQRSRSMHHPRKKCVYAFDMCAYYGCVYIYIYTHTLIYIYIYIYIYIRQTRHINNVPKAEVAFGSAPYLTRVFSVTTWPHPARWHRANHAACTQGSLRGMHTRVPTRHAHKGPYGLIVTHVTRKAWAGAYATCHPAQATASHLAHDIT